MIPRLPPELIAHVQSLAEEGQSPAQRKKLRATLELVNKEWYNLVDPYTFLIITKPSDVSRLRWSVRRPNGWMLVGAKMRTIAVELDELSNWAQARLLFLLLDQARKTESIFLRLPSGGLRLVNGSKNGTSLVQSLARLANLRHFELDRPTGSAKEAIVTDLQTVQMLAHSWHKLESFTLLHSSLGGVPPDVALRPAFNACPNLKALVIRHKVKWSALSSLLSDLPSALKTLVLCPTEKSARSWRSPALLDRLAPVAPHLTNFSFVETKIQLRALQRGFLDDFVPKLSSVRVLTLQPHAVTHLATQLGALHGLEELTIAHGPSSSLGVKCDVFEVAALVRQSPSLQRLAICDDLWASWTSGNQNLLARVTRNKDVTLSRSAEWSTS